VGRLGASVEFNEVDIFNPDAASSTKIDAIYRVPFGSTVAFSQRVSFTWDGRNNPFAATRGALVAMGVEHVNAFPVGGSDNPAKDTSHFFRLTGRVAGYVELGKKKGSASLAMSLASGYNLQLNDVSKTYPDRFFFLGGVDTIRSFLTDALVPQDRTPDIYASGRTSRSEVIKDITVRGGNFSVNPRIELRLPFGDTFQAGIFLDSGNLWIDPRAAMAEFRLRYALGAGLRINTPVGPLALDYGINLDRREWEDFGALHFAIGLF
jgi:outer membrane protein assembly factor BamA